MPFHIPIIAVLLLTSQNQRFADDSIRASVMMMAGPTIHLESEEVSYYGSSGLNYGGAMAFQMSSHLSLQGDVGYSNFFNRDDWGPSTYFSIFASGRYKALPGRSRFEPFVRVGAGYFRHTTHAPEVDGWLGVFRPTLHYKGTVIGLGLGSMVRIDRGHAWVVEINYRLAAIWNEPYSSYGARYQKYINYIFVNFGLAFNINGPMLL